MADQNGFQLAKYLNWSENGQWPTFISSRLYIRSASSPQDNKLDSPTTHVKCDKLAKSTM